jgi:hypothetical protein
MEKHCKACTSAFTVTMEDLAFQKKLSPVVGGKEMTIPEPTLCPDCRQQRRMSFRNDHHYYKNTCVFCKKNVISIYSPDKGLPILCHECFWSDQWSGLTYGQEWDASRTLKDQFAALKKTVPRLCIFNTQSENSDYTVHSSRNKNCYMCSSIIGNENIYFSDFIFDSSDSIDCFSCENMELCSGCIYSEDCYNGDWLNLCFNLTDAMFCIDCKGGNRLLGCVGKRNASDQILNESVTPEEFDSTRNRLLTDSSFRQEFKKKVDALRLTVPVPHIWQIGSENCSGNYLFHCKNVQHGFNAKYFEDCRYVYEGHKDTDCCDIMRCGSCEMLYDCTNGIDLKLSAFCNLAYQCDNMLYCDNCHSSSSCFGCFGLKKAKYCILNKQYTKEEYERIVPTIIEQMRTTGEYGEFFPTSISSFGYNESKAMEWYPLSKEEVLARGWQWSDYEQTLPQDIKGIDAKRLPENIADVPDDILTYVITPENGGKPFRLIPQELALYRKKGLPVPRLHPHDRLLALTNQQNPRALYARTCDKCQKTIETTYSLERPEKVYCEHCYLETVY